MLMPTHGSISKAGKVKWAGCKPTLQIQIPKKPKFSPKLANKRKYRLRETLHRSIGQYEPY
jgi:ribosomal protein S30